MLKMDIRLNFRSEWGGSRFTGTRWEPVVSLEQMVYRFPIYLRYIGREPVNHFWAEPVLAWTQCLKWI